MAAKRPFYVLRCCACCLLFVLSFRTLLMEFGHCGCAGARTEAVGALHAAQRHPRFKEALDGLLSLCQLSGRSSALLRRPPFVSCAMIRMQTLTRRSAASLPRTNTAAPLLTTPASSAHASRTLCSRLPHPLLTPPAPSPHDSRTLSSRLPHPLLTLPAPSPYAPHASRTLSSRLLHPLLALLTPPAPSHRASRTLSSRSSRLPHPLLMHPAPSPHACRTLSSRLPRPLITPPTPSHRTSLTLYSTHPSPNVSHTISSRL